MKAGQSAKFGFLHVPAHEIRVQEVQGRGTSNNPTVALLIVVLVPGKTRLSALSSEVLVSTALPKPFAGSIPYSLIHSFSHYTAKKS